MRAFLLIGLLSVFALQGANAARIQVEASDYVGKTALLYTYEDYFSLRVKLVAQGIVNDSGKVVFDLNPSRIELVKLKINHVVADFFVEPEGNYEIVFGMPPKGVARTISGNTKVNPLFLELDRFDINALLTDMNARLDAFLFGEYGKEKASDQQAAFKAQMESKPVADSAGIGRSTLPARIDTFERKITSFYSEVDHPFFKQQLRYAIAQMRITKEHTRKKLFEQYLKEQPIDHHSPEYVKFFKKFFHRHLVQEIYTKKPDELQATIRRVDEPALMALLQQHDFLQNNELAELVMCHELYLEFGNEDFSKGGILKLLGSKKSGKIGEIAMNCYLELSEMAPQTQFPSNIELWSPMDATVHSTDTLRNGFTYVAISASWCTYCEQELSALGALIKEYGNYVNFVVISVDDDVDTYRDNMAFQVEGASTFFAGADPLIFDKLRLSSLPSFYLLDDGLIVHAPASAPSQGIGREFHRIKTAAEKGGKIKFWDD